MPILLTVLTLGDPSLSLHMIQNSNLEFGGQDQEISQWKRSIDRGFDRADIELKVTLSSTADIDMHIQTADGIIYFLDPNDQENFDLFELKIDIIQKMERTPPIIVVFYTRKGLINTPSNYLLEYIWENYLMEAFVYDSFSKNTFYEVLECLTEAMTVGSVPINVETAWMRIPFFVSRINRLLDGEQHKDAGVLTEILKNMKAKFNKQDYYITAEQAAWLYFKSGEYRKTANVLMGINNKDSEKFMRIHVENLVHQANIFYKVPRFSRAAEKYEEAYLIALIELKDKALAHKLLKLAIKAWIKSTDFLSAFKLLEKLDYNERIEFMRELESEIGQSIDILIENKQFDLVKGYLYFILDELQRNDLFEETRILGTRMVLVLKTLIKQSIQEIKPDDANLTLRELFDFWETYPIDRENVDELIQRIVKLFVDKDDLDYLDDLINHIQSKSIRKELAELRQEAEDRITKQHKDTEYADFSNAVSILQNYVEKEIEIFSQSNTELYKHIEELKKQKKVQEITTSIKKRADWFKKIGHKALNNEVLTHLLDFYLDVDLYFPLLQEISNLGNKERKKYLQENLLRFRYPIELDFIESQESTEKINALIIRFIDMYRNNLLFDELKILEQAHIKFFIGRVKRILDTSSGMDGVSEVLSLLEQAEMVNEGLPEEKPLEIDQFYETISERFIKQIETKVREQQQFITQKHEFEFAESLFKEILNDIRAAFEHIQRIKDTKIRSRLHKQLTKIETEITKTSNSSNLELELTAKLSNLSKRVSEAKEPLNDVFRKRTTFIRMYRKVLKLLNSEKWEMAANEYFVIANKDSRKRGYDTASVHFLLGTLCFFKIEKDNEHVLELLDTKIVGKPFPKELLRLLIESNSNGFKKIFDEAWGLLKSIPVFEEEKILFTQ